MQRNIQNFLNEAVKDGVFPGCVCAIINNEQVQYYVSGNKSIYPSAEPLDKGTLYDLASLTKVVSTTPLILKLIQEKKISYQTPVFQILPQFQNKEVTIQHLLCHTSGFPADLGWKFGIEKNIILEDIYNFARNVKPEEKVIYSDIGFILLGEIIAKITHGRLEVASRKYVFEPLEMDNTTYLPEQVEKCAPTEICPYTHELLKGVVHDRKARCFGGVAGHAGVFSSIEDLVHYVIMILNDGVYNGHVFLDKCYIDDLFKKNTREGQVPRSIGFLCYDENGFFSKKNSIHTIGHTGFSGTSLVIDRDKKTGIILLSNRIHPYRENNKILEWRKKFHDFIMSAKI